MLPTRLNLEEFPDSSYAHELGRGTADLRFKAPLEAEYTDWHLQRVRLRVKIWFSLSVLLCIFFTIDLSPRTHAWTAASLLPSGALILCTVTLAWLPWSRHYERFYIPAGRVLVPVFCAIVAALTALALIGGRYEQLAVLTVDVLAVFFFSGLMFRQAALTTAIMLIAFAVSAHVTGLSQAMLLKSMAILTLTGIIGAVVYWDIEQSYRRSFLESALIRELIARDELSGLMNRRAFDEHLLRVWQHALRDQLSLAVLMIDVDHFKQYNDVRGHQAGDAALRSIARVIQDFARRPLDLAARYGGEEFAVILHDSTLAHVQDTADRLCQAVQNLHIKLLDAAAGAANPEVTVSIGAGLVVPSIGRAPQGAVQLADEALYEAKQSGRNRVIVKGTEDYRLLNTGAFKAPGKFLRQQ